MCALTYVAGYEYFLQDDDEPTELSSIGTNKILPIPRSLEFLKFNLGEIPDSQDQNLEMNVSSWIALLARSLLAHSAKSGYGPPLILAFELGYSPYWKAATRVSIDALDNAIIKCNRVTQLMWTTGDTQNELLDTCFPKAALRFKYKQITKEEVRWWR